MERHFLQGIRKNEFQTLGIRGGDEQKTEKNGGRRLLRESRGQKEL